MISILETNNICVDTSQKQGEGVASCRACCICDIRPCKGNIHSLIPGRDLVCPHLPHSSPVAKIDYNLKMKKVCCIHFIYSVKSMNKLIVCVLKNPHNKK